MRGKRANLGDLRRISKREIRKRDVRAHRDLQRKCESGDSEILLHTCTGATHGERYRGGGEEIREIVEIRTAAIQAVWTALAKREDIYAIAYRLGLSPNDAIDTWRLAALRIARSEAFIKAIPQDVPITRDDWQRWKALDASPRKMLGLLRKLVSGVRIWD